MRVSKKSQTATEYLVITAVVIIIAVLVVTILGGVPLFGKSADKQANDFALSIAPIGVTNYAVSDYDTVLIVRNNDASPLIINQITIDEQICVGLESFTLLPGKSREINCPNIFEFEGNGISFSIQITYTDQKTNATYTVDDDLKLIQDTIPQEYLRTLENTPSFNISEKGCWNSPTSPISLCTCYDLNRTRGALTSSYVVENNIDFERCQDVFGDAGWNSGLGWDAVHNFRGTVNGQGFIIQNLYINGQPGTSGRQGLFGQAFGTVTVYDLGLVDVDIRSTTADTGGLVARANTVNISNVFVTGSFTNTSTTGPVVGYINGGVLSNSYSTATVTTSTSTVGGLVGRISAGNITNSFATGNVIGQRAGGLVGRSESGAVALIENSFATGDVTSTETGSDVGGFIGQMNGGTIRDSYATGNVKGISLSDLGGFAGFSDGTIIASYTTGDVTATDTSDVGGFIGELGSSGNISDSYATGTVGFTTNTNGFIGATVADGGGIITSSNFSGFVNSSDTGAGFADANGGTFIDITWFNNTADNANNCFTGTLAPDAGGNCAVS